MKEYLKDSDKFYYDEFLNFLKKKRLRFKRHFHDEFNREKNLVIINYRRNIDDSLALIHEFSHYINYKTHKYNGYLPFNEVNSITYELLLSDYLHSKYELSNAKSQIQANMFENYDMAINAKLELQLYKFLMNAEVASIDDLPEHLRDYVYKIRLNYANTSLDKYGIYLLGNVFSAYIHQNILSQNLSISDYKFIRDSITNQDYINLKRILDLDFIIDEHGFDINKDSIKKLEKTYVDEVKYYESR